MVLGQLASRSDLNSSTSLRQLFSNASVLAGKIIKLIFLRRPAFHDILHHHSWSLINARSVFKSLQYTSFKFGIFLWAGENQSNKEATCLPLVYVVSHLSLSPRETCSSFPIRVHPALTARTTLVLV